MRPNSGPENQRTGPPVKISISGDTQDTCWTQPFSGTLRVPQHSQEQTPVAGRRVHSQLYIGSPICAVGHPEILKIGENRQKNWEKLEKSHCFPILWFSGGLKRASRRFPLAVGLRWPSHCLSSINRGMCPLRWPKIP